MTLELPIIIDDPADDDQEIDEEPEPNNPKEDDDFTNEVQDARKNEEVTLSAPNEAAAASNEAQDEAPPLVIKTVMSATGSLINFPLRNVESDTSFDVDIDRSDGTAVEVDDAPTSVLMINAVIKPDLDESGPVVESESFHADGAEYGSDDTLPMVCDTAGMMCEETEQHAPKRRKVNKPPKLAKKSQRQSHGKKKKSKVQTKVKPPKSPKASHSKASTPTPPLLQKSPRKALVTKTSPSKVRKSTAPTYETLTNTVTTSQTLTNTVSTSKALTNTVSTSKALTNTASTSKTLTNTVTTSKALTSSSPKSKTLTSSSPKSKTLTSSSPKSKTGTKGSSTSKTRPGKTSTQEGESPIVSADPTPAVSCPKCSHSFPNAVDLERHEVQCLFQDGPNFSLIVPRAILCRCCNDVLPDKMAHRSHWSLHAPYVECRVCSVSLRSHRCRHLHEQGTHRRYCGQERDECEFCFARFPTPLERQQHESSHHQHYPFVCRFCHLHFVTVQGRLSHEITHLSIAAAASSSL